MMVFDRQACWITVLSLLFPQATILTDGATATESMASAFGVTKESVRYIQAQPDFHSSIHCVGENFSSSSGNANDAWKSRSCKFRNLCYEANSQEFFLVRSLAEQKLQELLDRRKRDMKDYNDITISTSMKQNEGLALQSLTAESDDAVDLLKWFPTVRDSFPESTEGYYYEIDAVWFLFKSSLSSDNGLPIGRAEASNVISKVMWNDLLPMFTVLDVFGLSCSLGANNCPPLMMTNLLPTPTVLTSLARLMAAKLVGTVRQNDQHHKENNHIVCSRHGIAGVGLLSALSDSHALKDDYHQHSAHNVARSIVLQDFVAFARANLNMSNATNEASSSALPLLLWPNRDVSYIKNNQLYENRCQQEYFDPSGGNWKEKVQLASHAAGMVAVCGQAALAAFLPRGAKLLLLCDEKAQEDLTARQEIDLFVRAGYLQTKVVSADDTTAIEAWLREMRFVSYE